MARITRRVDHPDGWVAFLNQHRPFEPRVVKQCSSFEAGKRGIELWAERRQERLEYEAGRINALRPKMAVAAEVICAIPVQPLKRKRVRIAANP